MSPKRTIGWAGVIFLVPFVELLGRNILANLNDLQPLVFDWALVAFFCLAVIWLVAFASRAAAGLLLAFSLFSLAAMTWFIFGLVPHTALVTTKVYDFGLLFLWIATAVLMICALQATVGMHRRLRPAELIGVFD